MDGTGVYDILTHSSRAELEGQVSLEGCQGLARWKNGRDRVRYPGADHHTLSIYLSGYENAERTDCPVHGVDGSFCLMPAGSESEWLLKGPIRFTHIYFNNRTVRSIAEKVFDQSGSHWSVPEVTYQEDRQLMLLSQWLLRASMTDMQESPLLAEQNVILLMTYLLSRLFRRQIRPIARGGLSDRNKGLVRDYIQSRFREPIHIKDLAALSGLSEFHFQRMFKESFHMTPHEYLNRVRVSRAEQMILRDLSLSRIGEETGFSSQAHFTRVFRRYTGLTPGRFRKNRS